MRSQNCHLLIVDDDEDDRYILDLSFRQIQWGEHIKLLGSGDDMFRHLDGLSNPSSYPSLILLDYNMPRMGAEEIINRLKRHEHYNSIKVAVYSTAMTEALKTRLQALGAVDVTARACRWPRRCGWPETLKKKHKSNNLSYKY